MKRPRLTRRQRELLNELEAVVRSIRYPVDSADFFHAQVCWALRLADFNYTREVSMEPSTRTGPGSWSFHHSRRVDIVVVDRRGNVAMELDRDEVPDRTRQKMLDLPADVIRFCVLRQPMTKPEKVPGVDRLICLNADMRAVPWLVSGDAILEERAAPLPPFKFDDRARQRAAEAGEARRLIGGGLYCAKVRARWA